MTGVNTVHLNSEHKACLFLVDLTTNICGATPFMISAARFDSYLRADGALLCNQDD